MKQTWLGLGKLAWSVKQMTGGGKKKDKNKKKGKKEKAADKKSAMDHFLKAHGLQIKFTANAADYAFTSLLSTTLAKKVDPRGMISSLKSYPELWT